MRLQQKKTTLINFAYYGLIAAAIYIVASNLLPLLSPFIFALLFA